LKSQQPALDAVVVAVVVAAAAATNRVTIASGTGEAQSWASTWSSSRLPLVILSQQLLPQKKKKTQRHSVPVVVPALAAAVAAPLAPQLQYPGVVDVDEDGGVAAATA
jgi:hypothetical protein